MPTTSENNKRIAKNTLLLYFRMIFMMVVSLYTVPIVLKNLGASNYGLYSVIGGVVSMFSFLSGSLGSGTQRYIAFAIGKGDKKLLDNTFQTTTTIFLVFGIISLILVEGIGLWFLNNKMNIPSDRMVAANYVFHFSVVAFIVGILSVPYNAAIIAHERMGVYAYVTIFECVAKLAIALLLTIAPIDKLIFYAAMLLALNLLLRVYYQIYCYKKFEECRQFGIKWDPSLGRHLLAYSGWNTIGVLAIMGKNQGLNIIMNLFFGTMLNAAHAIAMQVNGVVTRFINNIYTATRPPITKLYAAGDIDGMWNLVFRSAKLAFYLLMILSVPAIVELETILDWWLDEVPPYTVSIAILTLTVTLTETLTNQLCAAFQAADKIKHYQQYSSTILLMCLPLSYLILKFWINIPLIPYIVSAILSLLYVITITYIAKRDIGLDVLQFLRRVLIPDVSVFVIVFATVFLASRLMTPCLLRVGASVAVDLIVSALVIWLIGTDNNEKSFIVNTVKSKIKKK